MSLCASVYVGVSSLNASPELLCVCVCLRVRVLVTSIPVDDLLRTQYSWQNLVEVLMRDPIRLAAKVGYWALACAS
jgi:hypothetical protein